MRAGGHGVPCGAETGPSPGGGPGRPALALALGLTLPALLLPAPAPAGDLSARADLALARDETTVSESEYFRQVYFLDYRRQVSQPIAYRLSLRYQDDRGDTQAGGERFRLRSRVLAPTAGFDWRLDDFAFSLTWRRNDEATYDRLLGRDVSRVVERLSLATWFRAFEGGEVDLLADRLSYASAAVSTEDERFGVNFRYGLDRFRVANENRLQYFLDRRTGLARTSMGPRLMLAYARGFGATGAVSSQYTVDYFRSEQELKAGEATVVATEVQPVAAGLWLVDDLPLDTPPLTQVPALVDRAFEVGAGLSLGPADPVFQNIGLDVGRVVPLDELRLHVRGATGAPVPPVADLGWRVYSSLDGLRWSQVDGATSAFSADLSAWQVTFPPVTARYFKLVSFGRYAVEVVVTELQGFLHETFQPNAPRVSSSVRQSLTLSVTGRPLAWLSLAATGQANADALSSSLGGRPRWTTDATGQVSAVCGPFGPWLLEATQGVTMARQPLGISQDSLVTSAAVRYQPLERLGAALEARRAQDHLTSSVLVGGVTSVQTVTHGVTLSSQAVFLEALRGSAQLGANRQDIDGGGSTTYLSGSGQLMAGLLRELDLSLEANLQRTLSRQGDTSAQAAFPILRVLTYQRYTAEARYHPSVQLSLSARLGWSESDTRGGLVQSYRTAWQPFPDGAVQLYFDYSEDVDPLSDRTLRRFSAAPRWAVNRSAFLELSYNLVRGTGELPVRQQNLYLTFSLKL